MAHLRNKGITLDTVLRPTEALESRKTKIFCTLGPACDSKEMLLQMIDAGMNTARLNFSHGDHESHGRTVENLRAAMAERPGCNIMLMLDTKGPEIRTGFLVDKKPIELAEGQDLILTTDYEHIGDATKIACSYPSLPTSVSVGGVILAADGNIVMTVKELRETEVVVTVMNSATLGERKNMNLPGVVVDLPVLMEKDRHDLVEFGLKYNIDSVAASFVRKASDVHEIRECLGPAGAHIKIISKIENQEGLENFDEILEATDAIMVARGDLGMEIPPEKVFLAQKMMIRKCNLAGKPVVTATQMLESMIKNPRPTRAECTDVANAVIDGTDCVMLSGETAGGSYPLRAVNMMARVCVEVEAVINYDQLYLGVRQSTLEESKGMDVTESVASSAVKTSIELEAKLIVACSETGRSVRSLAKYRPHAPILALTSSPETARYVSGMMRGVRAIVMGSMLGTDGILMRAVDTAKEWGWLETGSPVVCVHGMLEARPGATNLVKVMFAE